jgi:uncharacterized membrane protein YobD (UPF0266 family)
MIYLLTAFGSSPGASSTVHIYTQTIHRTTYKQQLAIVYTTSNRVGHLITSTIITLLHFATLHHTSPNYTPLHLSTLHFLSFTLHYSPIWLNPSTFPIVLFHLTSLN